LVPTKSKGDKELNRRPYIIESSWGSGEDFWWLSRDGVDLKAPANNDLLTVVTRTRDTLPLKEGASTKAELTEQMAILQALETAIKAAHARQR
jgi:hypothetical protein